jgi:hypothetical protein
MHKRGSGEYAQMYTCEHLSCDTVAACKASTCDVCGVEKCADEFLACNKDGNCYAFGFCFQHCKGDTTCIGKCQTAFPSSVKAFDTLVTCLSNKCTASC